jgi:predicted HTH domain antitoxin
MPKVITTMELSEDAYLSLSSLGFSKKKIAEEARHLLAANLYQKGMLSLGKSAELSGMNMEQFILLLNDLNIPVVDYDEDELKAEFKTVKGLVKSK